MAKQLCADPVLSERLTRPWKRVVVLERQARGGGSHHWYYTDTPQGFEEVLARVGGGSLISFYFGDTMTVESLSEDSVGRMFAAQQIESPRVSGRLG